MSWWGSGSNNDNDNISSSSSGAKDFKSDGETSGFGGGSNMMASGSGGGGDSGMAELQQAGLALQQQLLVQQVINDLTDRSYEKCITGRPSSELSGSHVACIKATVNKWLDTNEFMTGRLAKKQQQAASQHSQY